MSIYNLSTDEAVILNNSDVTCNGANVTLILTNQNIIQVNKGLFGGDRKVFKFPLLELKLLNGKPNVRVGKSGNGETQLELYFEKFERAYIIKGILSEKKWANAIEKAYKTAAAEKKKAERQGEKSNLGAVFAPVKNTFENAKNVITTKGQKPRKMKCPQCGAELAGTKGEQVKCSYCDALITIQ